MEEKTINKKVVFNGLTMRVRVDDVMLSNGQKAIREVIEKPDAVCIAPITKSGELIFVKQHRYAISKTILELPAGKMDDNETDPLDCAKRELLEETGAIGENYLFLGEFHPSAPSITNRIYLFLCNVKEIGQPRPDENEILEVVKVPFDKALKMVVDGEIADAKSQIAILKLMLKLKNIF